MEKSFRSLKTVINCASILLLSLMSCASVNKHVAFSKKEDSLCDLTHLGKNKYFYSSYYQRKLAKSVRTIKMK